MLFRSKKPPFSIIFPIISFTVSSTNFFIFLSLPRLEVPGTFCFVFLSLPFDLPREERCRGLYFV